MTPLVSVITPFSRGIKELSQLMRDFKNQTFVSEMEHLIIRDGPIPPDIQRFMDQHRKDYNVEFFSVEKDMGNMVQGPGTKPRNYGISKARGRFVIFFDDDDRCKDTYVETLLSGASDKSLAVVQMSCQESRIYRNGNPNRIILVPEIGLSVFPVICHVGTPCTIIPREWALAEPWKDEPEHDFRFLKRIVDRFHPIIQIIPGMQVDVDGLVTRGMHDWVSVPPFYRN